MRIFAPKSWDNPAVWKNPRCSIGKIIIFINRKPSSYLSETSLMTFSRPIWLKTKKEKQIISPKPFGKI